MGRGVRAIILISDTLHSLIHIAINFHQDISYGYLVMACTRRASEIYQRDVTLKNEKGEAIILVCDTVPNQIYIATKFYYNIPKGNPVLACAKIV